MHKASVLLMVEDSAISGPLQNALDKVPALVQTIVHGLDDVWTCLSEGVHHILYIDFDGNRENCVQWLEKISQRYPDVYIMTGSKSITAKDAIGAIQAGAADVIVDPSDQDLVKAAFEKALGSIKPRQPIAPRNMHLNKTMVTQDPVLVGVLDIARKVAPSNATVMISGESGTGKELLAKFIHVHSKRENEPYLAVNCAALPEQLAESELFGHEKGAFTGAISRKRGKFESAGNGTLVLDEITEMPLPLQAKLLRALQEREVVRIGSNHPISVAARVIAISNRDLKQAVASGNFREDLYYRLSVIPLTIPPLRERKNDIPLLAEHFFRHFSQQSPFVSMQQISKATMERLTGLSWPGNVRELENTIERGVLIGSGEELLPEHLMLDATFSSSPQKPTLTVGTTVREMEKELIFKTLSAVNDNRTHAAKMLGISIRTLRNKLNEYRETLDGDGG